MNLTDEFTALIFGLQAAKIDCAVCGGWAMGLHGFPRFTKDFDFLVQANDLPRILDVVKKCGYDEQRDHPICESSRFNKFQGEDHTMVDFILVNPRLEEIWTGRTSYAWQGLNVPVVSAAGLARMKRLAGRPQDLVDIQTLGYQLDDPALQS